MKRKFLILLFLFLISCSKNPAKTEEPLPTSSESEFQLIVKDRQGVPYTCGFVKLGCEEASNSGKQLPGNPEFYLIRALNTQGQSRFIFSENRSMTIKYYCVLDYLFTEIKQMELNLSVLPGEVKSDTVHLNPQENVNVYWERPDFSQSFDLTGKKILTVVGDDYDFMECQMITRYLAYFGAELIIASNRLDVSSHYWLRIGGGYRSFPAPDSVAALLQNQNFLDFDCLFFPGGSGPANLLREYPEITSGIYQAWQTDSIFISAICHGPLLLAASDIIDGRQVTGFPEIQSSLTQAGGIYLPGEAVVVDGNIQTGNWPRFNTFAYSMAEILQNW